MSSFLNKLIKFPLYLLVFLLPLFWLPFSFEILEFNKQYLLFFLVSISFLAWISKMILIENEIHFRRTPLTIPVLIFLLTAIFSFLFSLDKNSSLFGSYGRFSNGLISLVLLIVFSFLIINNTEIEAKDKNKLNVGRLIKIFLFSVFFVILTTYLSIFGVLEKISSQFPWIVTQNNFNPIGSLESLAVFLSIIIVLLISLFLISEDKKKWPEILGYWILLISSFGLLIIVNSKSAWMALFLSLVSFLFFTTSSRIFREKVSRLLLPTFLIVVVGIFIFLNTSGSKNFEILTLPKEEILNQRIGWGIVLKSIRESLKRGVFGSGIGTFYYDFTKFKPVEFNQSLAWQTRYDRSGNYVSEILGTTGILGLLSYFILLGVFFSTSWQIVTQKPKSEKLLISLITLSALFLSHFFYYQNSVLAFSFWFFLSLSIVYFGQLIPEKEFSFSFKNLPELRLIFPTLLIIFSLFIFGIYFFGIKFYLADLNYAKSYSVSLTSERIKILEKAVELNPKFISYRIALANNYLLQVFEDEGKEPAPTTILNLDNSIEQAKTIIQISPQNVVGWETLGLIYENIQPLILKANEWAIKCFEEAIKLEPANPLFYTEIGKLYLRRDTTRAREYFLKAQELKPDYLDALVQEALLDEREYDFDRAIRKMENVVGNYPFDAESLFQLGRLYFQKQRIEEAVAQFESVIYFEPNHSAALYYLGMAYEQKGEIEKAVLVLERFLELYPDNPEIVQKVKNLKSLISP